MFKFFTAFLLFISFNSYALPLPLGAKQYTEFPQSFSEEYNFAGIVALSNCSGSLVKFETSKDTDFAMVLTNGHCISGMIPYGQVIVHEPSSRTFRLLNSSGQALGQIRASEILYATMTKTDMAIYKLRSTYAEIKTQYNIEALTLSSQHQTLGENIEVISGYWRRGYRCSVEANIYQLKEGDWIWEDSIRYSRPGCEVIGGTSGSPIVAAGTRTIIGINNTGNEDGRRCTINNPCEIDENGNVTYTQGYSYGQQTFWIYSCLNEQNELELTKPDCALPH